MHKCAAVVVDVWVAEVVDFTPLAPQDFTPQARPASALQPRLECAQRHPLDFAHRLECAQQAQLDFVPQALLGLDLVELSA